MGAAASLKGVYRGLSDDNFGDFLTCATEIDSGFEVVAVNANALEVEVFDVAVVGVNCDVLNTCCIGGVDLGLVRGAR
jgi:hypothetical protein